MFTALFPCNECAKQIIQAKIKEVVYYSDRECALVEIVVGKKLLDMAGIW